jgi:hypothetical protein
MMSPIRTGAAVEALGKFAAGSRSRRCTPLFFGLLLAALAGCNGTAVVTLTSTPSTDTFLAYRVNLVSVQVQTSKGRNNAAVLPSSTTVDLARLTNLADVVGAVGIAQGNFSQVAVTLDYSSAQIIYDDGTPEGVALTPVGPSGQPRGQVTMTLYLDPSNQLSIIRKGSARLSLEFNLAASNVVDLTQKTVTVTPLMAASAAAIDSKTVRVRGTLGGVSTSNTDFDSGIEPFDFSTAGSGSLEIVPSNATTYEINGKPSTGTAGLTDLAALSPGAMVESFGTMTSSGNDTSALDGTTTTTTGTTETCSDGTTPETVNGVLECTDGATLVATNTAGTTETCSDGTTPETVNGILECTDGATLVATNTDDTTGTTISSVSFSASQVLAGSSAQGWGFDRVSGIVTGRSGDTLTVDDGTLIANDGTNTLIAGTATILIGPNTTVTQFGAGSVESNGSTQISVGSLIYAYGTASSVSSSSVTLDASAGRVRIGQSTASGIVSTVPATGGSLTLNLTTLGGRSIKAFDFLGTGTSASADANPAQYKVTTGSLTLTNATAGEPVEATGYVTAFGTAPPDFGAQTLLDYTTINAELVVDWNSGTAAPFASYNTSTIIVDARNSAIGTRHEIQIGGQTVNIVGIAQDPQIVANSSANTVFTIGHSVSGSFESFNTYSAFISELQTELTGSVLATNLTAVGQYTANSYSFSASSITLTLAN